MNPVEPATYAARDDRGDDALQAAIAANAARVAEVAFSPRATEARSSTCTAQSVAAAHLRAGRSLPSPP